MNALRRLDLEEDYTALAARAIRLRHPEALWIAHHPATSLTDRVLVAAVERLEAWIAEHGD
jgi:hypothetical protein